MQLLRGHSCYIIRSYYHTLTSVKGRVLKNRADTVEEEKKKGSAWGKNWK